MRIKQKIDNRTKCPVLMIDLDKGAELDYEDTAIILGGVSPFARVQVTPREKAPILKYQLNPDDVPLDKYLKRSLDARTITRMLVSFAEVAECTEFYSLSLQHVMFDPARIYCNEQTGALTFVYVPTRAFVDVEHDIRSALISVCRMAKPLHRSYEDVLVQIEDYTRRSAMFTAIDYRKLLRRFDLDSAVCNQGNPSQDGTPTGTTSFNDSRTTSFGFDFVQEQERAQEAAEEAMFDAFEPSTPINPEYREVFILTHVGSGNTWGLGEGMFTVGREPDNSIVLANIEGVSRRHAIINVNGETVTVRDENSTNGVKVNGTRIPPLMEMPVQAGDMLLIGRGAFTLSCV